MSMLPVKSTCPYCGVGCGVVLQRDGDTLHVEGDQTHPANKGRLCSKGLALGETVSLDGRLLTPEMNGAEVSWDPALDRVAHEFREAITHHGPDSVAFYVSGQLLTEDYYVANKLMKGFIGSANIDTNSRLCMASTVAGHKRAFGTDTVPGIYDDLEEADLVVLVGSNLAWCHPVLFQRLAAARKSRGTKIVVVDPRRTATCDIADMHLAITPGSDVALFNGLLNHLAAQGHFNTSFLERATEGGQAALDIARASDVTVTGLSQRFLETFFDLFARTERVVTVFSQGVNQSTSGVDKVNAILNCHLATGRIGRPGMGPFSVTGQPNAMGGRETGGLANMLAAHLDLEDAAHRAAVQDFWDAPTIARQPGLKAVDMFKAVGDGQIKALWIACTNPAVSMPDAEVVRASIKACPFVVVSDVTGQTDTARLADVLLPAAAWGEKDGTVTNSDRTISRQRAAIPLPGQVKPDWQIFSEVGKRMGWGGSFDYDTPAQIFREHAALSGIAGSLGRDFDISGLAGLTDADYDGLEPMRWPVTANKSGGRFFGDGRFFTPSGKARLISVEQQGPATKRSPKYPYRLNTGRVRDQWHTMTRTAKSTRLSRHMAEPFLALHPQDADDLGLAPADLAHVSGPGGTAILRVYVTEDVGAGTPFAPMHWTAETAPSGRIGGLVQAAVDPISGQPESKASVVAIERFDAAWYGFAVSRNKPQLRPDYAVTMRTEGGWRTELAGDMRPEDWSIWAQDIFSLEGTFETFEGGSQTRLALWAGDRLDCAVFVSDAPVMVARDYVAGLLVTPRPHILAGRPAADLPDPGPTVCSCMGVGRNVIIDAIQKMPGMTVDQVGAETQAGVTCGSCRPEISDLIARHQLVRAAE